MRKVIIVLVLFIILNMVSAEKAYLNPIYHSSLTNSTNYSYYLNETNEIKEAIVSFETSENYELYLWNDKVPCKQLNSLKLEDSVMINFNCSNNIHNLTLYSVNNTGFIVGWVDYLKTNKTDSAIMNDLSMTLNVIDKRLSPNNPGFGTFFVIILIVLIIGYSVSKRIKAK